MTIDYRNHKAKDISSYMCYRIEAALYLEQASHTLAEKADQNASKLFSDEAGNMYERATTGLLSKTLILYFAYADFEEVGVPRALLSCSSFRASPSGWYACHRHRISKISVHPEGNGYPALFRAREGGGSKE